MRLIGNTRVNTAWVVGVVATVVAIIASTYSYRHGYIILYGDAESHLNIAKRVFDGLTPGMAQLGGIWLPLPHMLLIPFVSFNFLWRSGLAGSIVSGIAFVVSSIYIYKFVHLITNKKYAGLLAALIFITNPNILYLQTTPMTELPLIVFFILSSYFFVLFLNDSKKFTNLIAAAFFCFCASLSRYDGWALALSEAGLLILYYFPFKQAGSYVLRFTRKAFQILKQAFSILEGRFIIFVTVAFFGIVLWLLWGWIILGDPLYFTHSVFSAKSQQNGWMMKGELPAKNDIILALKYYAYTSLKNTGTIISILSLAGLLFFAITKNKNKWFILILLLVPFIFNVVTLYLGQSVIFIPGLTPDTFEWNLFNVRYGTMMVPFAAVFAGYFFSRVSKVTIPILLALILIQVSVYAKGNEKILTLEDGLHGLSSQVAKMPDAQFWLQKNYDYGLLITDDFSRTISIVRTPVRMQDVIYVGTKPYWEETLAEPEKYARWIIIQKDDALWQAIWERPEQQARLYKYFNKVYTSDTILIFKRIEE